MVVAVAVAVAVAVVVVVVVVVVVAVVVAVVVVVGFQLPVTSFCNSAVQQVGGIRASCKN